MKFISTIFTNPVSSPQKAQCVSNPNTYRLILCTDIITDYCESHIQYSYINIHCKEIHTSLMLNQVVYIVTSVLQKGT
jgi:hypothetical protein